MAVASTPLMKKGHGFTRKCAALVQEQRARIYVLRRCATMLLCWYIHGDEFCGHWRGYGPHLDCLTKLGIKAKALKEEFLHLKKLHTS